MFYLKSIQLVSSCPEQDTGGIVKRIGKGHISLPGKHLQCTMDQHGVEPETMQEFTHFKIILLAFATAYGEPEGSFLEPYIFL